MARKRGPAPRGRGKAGGVKRKRKSRFREQAKCRFCRLKIAEVDYKDIPTLTKLTTQQGKPELLVRFETIPPGVFLRAAVLCDGKTINYSHRCDPWALARLQGYLANQGTELGKAAREEIREKCREARDQT